MNNFNITSSGQLEEPMVNNSSPMKKLLLVGVRLYRQLHVGRVAPCRFYPSCSEYAEEAIITHGALKGSLLTLRRLSRCRPLGPHGIDLVPEPKTNRSTH